MSTENAPYPIFEAILGGAGVSPANISFIDDFTDGFYLYLSLCLFDDGL